MRGENAPDAVEARLRHGLAAERIERDRRRVAVLLDAFGDLHEIGRRQSDMADAMGAVQVLDSLLRRPHFTVTHHQPRAVRQDR